METTEMHRDDPALHTFAATVVAIHPDGTIELDRTAFYARAGGQRGDTGWIGGIEVMETIYNTERSAVLHRCGPQAHARLKIGDTVDAQIDWHKRYPTMQLHTAQHLAYLAAVALTGIRESSGGDIDQNRARLDLPRLNDDRPLSSAELDEYLTSLVERDLPINRFVDAADPRLWWWEIEGHPAIPCGGTHVSRTSEIGDVDLTVKRKGARNTRITVTRTPLN